MQSKEEIKQLNNQDFLEARKREIRSKCENLLKELPSFVRDFYTSREGTNEDLTRFAYIKDIKEFLEYESKFLHCEPKDISLMIFERITSEDIDSYKTHLLSKSKSTTAKRKLASIASFYKFLNIKKAVMNNPTLKIDWPKTKENPIIWLDAEQTTAILEGILANNKQIYYVLDDGSFKLSRNKKVDGEIAKVKGKITNNKAKYKVDKINESSKKRREKLILRDYAIFTLFLGTGLRISELVSLNIQDINFRTDTILVTGKGNKDRLVSFNETVESALSNYIKLSAGRNGLQTKNATSEALFLSSGGNRISVRQVEDMVKEMVRTYYPYTENDIDEVTGIVNSDTFRDKFSPHKLRSTFATRVLKQTDGNIKLVSDLCGHTDTQITARRYAAIKKEEELEKNKELNLTDY